MTQSLEAVAQAMVAPGKGILAADESSGTIKKRFDAIRWRTRRPIAATTARCCFARRRQCATTSPASSSTMRPSASKPKTARRWHASSPRPGPARHQGRRRRQAIAVLPWRDHHGRPRRPARTHQRLRRSRRQVRQVARRHRHWPQYALLQRHQCQRASSGALCGALRRGRPGADRRARGADGWRARHRHLREDDGVGAQRGLCAALLCAGAARANRAQAQHGDRRQEVRQAGDPPGGGGAHRQSPASAASPLPYPALPFCPADNRTKMPRRISP